VRKNIKAAAPAINFVFHDAFHCEADLWNDLFDDDDMENVIMDTLYYKAW